MNLNLNHPSLYSYLHNRISIPCPQTAGLRRHHELVHCTEIPQVRSNLGCERFGWKPKQEPQRYILAILCEYSITAGTFTTDETHINFHGQS